MKKIALFLCAVMIFTFSPVIDYVNPVQQNAPIVAQAAVKLNKKNVTLLQYKTVKLKVKGTKKKVKWSSNNKKVATVNKNGKVTAKKPGTATITAKVGKKKYKCKVTVIKRYYEGGDYKATIDGKVWHFVVSDYTSPDPDDNKLGIVYFCREKAADSEEMLLYQEYYEIGNNKYRTEAEDGKTAFEFTVYSNYVVVKQIKGTLLGKNMSGKYTLVHRPYGG